MKKNYNIATLIFLLILSHKTCTTYDTILIIDFGSPITEYIAVCVQQLQVHSKICSYTDAAKEIQEIKPKGIILSGGPDHVTDSDSPRAPESIFNDNIPVLGICYGHQLLCVQFGGCVVQCIYPEQGKTLLYVTSSCALTDNIWPPGSIIPIWMGHKDCITVLPEGFKTIAYTAGSSHAIIANDTRKLYGVQFHPEVQHVKEGHCLINAFVRDIVQAVPDRFLKPCSFEPTLLTRSFLSGCCGINY